MSKVPKALLALVLCTAGCGGGSSSGSSGKTASDPTMLIGPKTVVSVDQSATTQALIAAGQYDGADPGFDEVTNIVISGELTIKPQEMMAVVTFTEPVGSDDEVVARLHDAGFHAAILVECLSYGVAFARKVGEIDPPLPSGIGIECLGQYALTGGVRQYPQIWGTGSAKGWELLLAPWDLQYRPTNPQKIGFLAVQDDALRD